MLRERSNIFWVFIFPMVLILVLGAAFGGDLDSRLGVVVDDPDRFGEFLVASLEAAEGIETRNYDDEEALVTDVERGQLEAGLIIPDDYDESLAAGEAVVLRFLATAGEADQGIRNTVEATVKAQASLPRAALFARAQGVGDYDLALDKAIAVAAFAPGVEVVEESVGEPWELATLDQFESGAYSQLLLFTFLTSLAAAAALIESRRMGVSRRMLSTPTPVRTILLGESLGRFGVAMVQGIFIMVGSALIFSVDWGDPIGAVSILVMFGLVAAGAAMLVGSLFRNEQQAGGLGVLLGLGLAALGGCMIPLAVFEIFSPTLWRVAHITPHAWAIEGFEDLIIRREGIGGILPQLGILAAYAAFFFTLASWRFRKQLTS
jgi:ABC-2 type transport system permease protein